MSPGDADRADVCREEVLLAMAAVLDGDVIGERSRLRSLLRYLVEEELDGRGKALKAYSIAVDVLGRGPDFDPNADSVVRVEANRLRGLLRRYYRTAGADDPIEILLPPGQYRPAFVRRAAVGGTEAAPTPPEPAPAQPRPTWRWTWRRRFLSAAAALAGVLLAAGLAAIAWLQQGDVPYVAASGAPVVEVGEIRSVLRDRELSFVASGVRSLLAADLAHFRTLRVRLQIDPTSPIAADLPPADFQVTGYLTRPGDSIRLQLMLVDGHTHELLWSVDRELPPDHGALKQQFVQKVHAVVGELASPSGALVAEEIRRLEAKPGADGDATEYACLLRWHAYDINKTAEHEARARACLTRLTEADSKIGEIWAAYALLLFLDWTREPETDPIARQQAALTAAEKAIRLDPFGSAGHEYRGSILLAMGRIEAARASFEKAVEYNPSKPDLRVHLGWTTILAGDWNRGIASIREGMALSPAPPSWFRIPLSMDAFRRHDFETALAEAEAIWRAGDRRGAPLALAAALKLNDAPRIARYGPIVDESADDPMLEIQALLDVPELLAEYRRTLAGRRTK